jgi:cytochrome c oxidase subunit 4
MSTRHVAGFTYLVVWIALLLLTTLTFGLSYVSLGSFALLVAVAIATAKGALIALYFMHLVEQRASSRLTLLLAVILIALLIVLAVADVLTRNPLAQPR